MNENYFTRLNAVNVNGKTEQKGKLTYLSWAYAWGEVKKLHPDAFYTIYENADGWIYHTDGRTCWVKTGVTVNGLEHIECLPILDQRNNSIKLEHVTSYDVNKAIQRSITKACGRHGLGLYIYAGEDLPEGEEPEAPPRQDPPKQDPPKQKRMATVTQIEFIIDNAPDGMYKSAMEAFGANLENMTYGQAEKLIARIKGESANG